MAVARIMSLAECLMLS